MLWPEKCVLLSFTQCSRTRNRDRNSQVRFECKKRRAHINAVHSPCFCFGDSGHLAPPKTISEWLDAIGLGPEADRDRDQPLRYVEALARLHYDQLGLLLSADREEIESLLDQIPFRAPAIASVPASASASVPASVSAPEPEPEPEPKMPTPHRRMFLDHWKASADKQAQDRAYAKRHGVADVELRNAEASGNLQGVVAAKRALATFLADHRLDEYLVPLSRSYACKTLEDLTSASEVELSAMADVTDMLPADRRRFFSAVAEARADAFFETLGVESLTQHTSEWTPERKRSLLEDLMSASEDELHDRLQAFCPDKSGRGSDEVNHIKRALDELRPCPATAVVQMLQAQPLNLEKLQARALGYTVDGHVDVGTVMSVQTDPQALINLIAEGEKRKHQHDREKARVRAVAAARAKAVQEEEKRQAEEKARQAEQAREAAEEKRRTEESVLANKVDELHAAAASLEHKDAMGVWKVGFKPPIDLSKDGAQEVECAADSADAWKKQLFSVGIRSISLETKGGSEAGLPEGVQEVAKSAASKAAGMLGTVAKGAAGAALVATGVGAVAAPLAASLIDSAVGAVEGAVGGAVEGGAGTCEYCLKCKVTEPMKLTFEFPDRVSIDCTGAGSFESKDFSHQPLLQAVSRDRSHDMKTKLESFVTSAAANDLEKWLDDIGLGDTGRTPKLGCLFRNTSIRFERLNPMMS